LRSRSARHPKVRRLARRALRLRKALRK